MPLDALCLAALKEELRGQIIGLRVDKIQQPERDELVFALRGPGGTQRLLLSAGASDARLHLTRQSFENPASPPMFCMLLRKHLTGARLLEISQPPMERLLELRFQAVTAFGEPCEKRLVAELMGRFANFILVDEDGIIIDCLRRIDFTASDRRQVLPGLAYRLPPGQDKVNPWSLDVSALQGALTPHVEKTGDKALLSAFSGLSPLICRELCLLAYGAPDAVIGDGGAALGAVLFEHLERAAAGAVTPYILYDEAGEPRDFSYIPIRQYEGLYRGETLESFSALVETYFFRRARGERVRQRASQMTKTVKNAHDRVTRKLAAQREELRKTESRERLRELGDIITANLHRMHRGMTVLRAQDFYAPEGGECEIPLDPLKTPQQNAAKYYKDYTKAKNAEHYLTGQIAAGEGERQYLGSVLEAISKAEGERDLSEIRQELVSTGYIRAQKAGKREKRAESAPLRFCSSTGMEIRVGRNNVQNDTLTLKSAYKSDIWLHAQKIHGSHVVISASGGTPDETTLYEAACLAAWFSAGRGSGKVPVDYCPVKHVKKPGGARPGMVIYTDYKTMIAEPDEALAERLRQK